MKITSIVKRIAALLILVAFFLPLSQCSQPTEQIDESGQVVATTYEYTDVSVLSFSGLELEGVAYFILFLWPVLLQLAAIRWTYLENHYAFLGTEVLLLLLTSTLAFRVSMVGDHIRYGAFVFALAAGVYGALTLTSLFARLRLTLQSRRA